MLQARVLPALASPATLSHPSTARWCFGGFRQIRFPHCLRAMHSSASEFASSVEPAPEKTAAETSEDFKDLLERMARSAQASTKPADSSNNNGRRKHGHIDVIVGPMFAGKTTALLSRVDELEAQGLRVLLVKSATDSRYAQSSIVTHDGRARQCVAVPRLSDLVGQGAGAASAAPGGLAAWDAVAIDEAQFFPDLVDFATHAAEGAGLAVVAAGLDGCFRRQRFGQMLDLVPLADTVQKLKARCAFCERAALFSLRVSADERTELVGGADVYRPVCRSHYVELNQIRTSSLSDEDMESDTAAQEAESPAGPGPDSPDSPVSGVGPQPIPSAVGAAAAVGKAAAAPVGSPLAAVESPQTPV